MKTFGIRCVNARFGTGGSEVQILSPRPKSDRRSIEPQESAALEHLDGILRSLSSPRKPGPMAIPITVVRGSRA